MQTPIMQRLKSIVDPAISYALYLILKPMTERFRSCMHTTAGLVISATTTKVKTGAAIAHYQAKGKLGQIAAATDMPVLSGTVTNAKWNVFVFTIDSAGTAATYMGTEAATEAAIKWPILNTEHAIIGYVKINPTGTGNFVGGTTPLGDATVVPNAQYISLVGMSFPGARVN